MQKSGIKFFRILPRTIVPLDSAIIFTLYAVYYTAHSHFRQYVFITYHTDKNQIIKMVDVIGLEPTTSSM